MDRNEVNAYEDFIKKELYAFFDRDEYIESFWRFKQTTVSAFRQLAKKFDLKIGYDAYFSDYSSNLPANRIMKIKLKQERVSSEKYIMIKHNNAKVFVAFLEQYLNSKGSIGTSSFNPGRNVDLIIEIDFPIEYYSELLELISGDKDDMIELWKEMQ